MILRASFDGKVLVPEGPVDLPQGRVFELHVHDPGALTPASPNGQRNGLPLFSVPATASVIRSDDVHRGEDEA